MATSLGANAQVLQAPARVAVDAAGNCYVTDPATGQVVVFDAFGRVALVKGGFAGPLAIALDSAGNSARRTYPITVDTTPPSVSPAATPSWFSPDGQRLVWTPTRDNMDMPAGGWYVNGNKLAYREALGGEESFDASRLDVKFLVDHGPQVLAVRQYNWLTHGAPATTGEPRIRRPLRRASGFRLQASGTARATRDLWLEALDHALQTSP